MEGGNKPFCLFSEGTVQLDTVPPGTSPTPHISPGATAVESFDSNFDSNNSATALSFPFLIIQLINMSQLTEPPDYSAW